MDDFKGGGLSISRTNQISFLCLGIQRGAVRFGRKFMQHALMLADRAEALGEIPVGALLVDDEEIFSVKAGIYLSLKMIRLLTLKLSHCVMQHKISKLSSLNTTSMSPFEPLVPCVRARFYIAGLNDYPCGIRL